MSVGIWKKRNSSARRSRTIAPVSPVKAFAPLEPPLLPELDFPNFTLSPTLPSSSSPRGSPKPTRRSLTGSNSGSRRLSLLDHDALFQPPSAPSTSKGGMSGGLGITGAHKKESSAVDESLKELQAVLNEIEIAVGFGEGIVLPEFPPSPTSPRTPRPVSPRVARRRSLSGHSPRGSSSHSRRASIVRTPRRTPSDGTDVERSSPPPDVTATPTMAPSGSQKPSRGSTSLRDRHVNDMENLLTELLSMPAGDFGDGELLATTALLESSDDGFPFSKLPNAQPPAPETLHQRRDRHVHDMEELLSELLTRPEPEPDAVPSGSGDMSMSLPPLTNRPSMASSSWSYDPDATQDQPDHDQEVLDEGIVLDNPKVPTFKLIPPTPETPLFQHGSPPPQQQQHRQRQDPVTPTRQRGQRFPRHEDEDGDMPPPPPPRRKRADSDEDMRSNYAVRGSEMIDPRDFPHDSEASKVLGVVMRKAWKQIKHSVKRKKEIDHYAGSPSDSTLAGSDPGHYKLGAKRRATGDGTVATRYNISRPRPISSLASLRRRSGSPPPSSSFSSSSTSILDIDAAATVPDDYAFLPGASTNRRAAIYVANDLALGSVPPRLSTAMRDGMSKGSLELIPITPRDSFSDHGHSTPTSQSHSPNNPKAPKFNTVREGIMRATSSLHRGHDRSLSWNAGDDPLPPWGLSAPRGNLNRSLSDPSRPSMSDASPSASLPIHTGSGVVSGKPFSGVDVDVDAGIAGPAVAHVGGTGAGGVVEGYTPKARGDLVSLTHDWGTSSPGEPEDGEDGAARSGDSDADGAGVNPRILDEEALRSAFDDDEDEDEENMHEVLPIAWQAHPLIRQHGLILSVVVEED